MPGGWDASIKLLCAAGTGEDTSLQSVLMGESFDVIATIQIGERLNEVADRVELFVAARNLSQLSILGRESVSEVLTPQVGSSRSSEIRITFAEGWTANEGDVLDVIATCKVTAGVNTDYSWQRSEAFIVAAAS